LKEVTFAERRPKVDDRLNEGKGMTDGTVPDERRDAYERWGFIGVGQGGGNIAARLFTRDRNPGIDDRIIIINTSDAEVQRNIDRVAQDLQVDRETISKHHVALFGPSNGVGNDFLKGELMAVNGFDEIFRPITNCVRSDALLYTAALGGGTGNGATPYIVNQCGEAPESGAVKETHGEGMWLSEIPQFVLAVWPFENEPVFRHFNAVCGLSRLLFRVDGTPNADMTLLASNTRVKEIAKETIVSSKKARQDEHLARIGFGSEVGDPARISDEYDLINIQLLSAIDLLTSAGTAADNVIAAKDFIRRPQRRGACHGTLGTAFGVPIGPGIDIPEAIEESVSNAYVPLDPSTADAAYVVIRAPEKWERSGYFAKEYLRNGFERWKSEHGLSNATGSATLTHVPKERSSMDVLVFLAGFDLDQLLDDSWEKYEEEKERVEENVDAGEAERIDGIDERIRTYVDRS
jgi:hypothetical protein